MNLINIPILKDNYVWILHNKRKCLIFDPGDSIPVLNVIENLKLMPVAILITHHHNDHVKGIPELLRHFNIPVYGPKEAIAAGITNIVSNKDVIDLLNVKFDVISLPGHTLDHVGFYTNPWLFSGDTIFSAGCGRILEGTYIQMYKSIQKINKFPSNTVICPSHEYTLKNLIFANEILPECNLISYYLNKIKNLRRKKKNITLPTTLYLERIINLFLRCHENKLKSLLKSNLINNNDEELQVFQFLRKKRDYFNIRKIYY